MPSPSGLQTALGVAGTLASIYGKLNPPQSQSPIINIGGGR
jgi:hypothetical protein